MLVLNACYLYGKLYGKDFTRSNIVKFASYYNIRKISIYFTVLMTYGYLVHAGKFRCYDLYNISELGIKVIEDINKDYEIELNRFLNDHSIEL